MASKRRDEPDVPTKTAKQAKTGEGVVEDNVIGNVDTFCSLLHGGPELLVLIRKVRLLAMWLGLLLFTSYPIQALNSPDLFTFGEVSASFSPFSLHSVVPYSLLGVVSSTVIPKKTVSIQWGSWIAMRMWWLNVGGRQKSATHAFPTAPVSNSTGHFTCVSSSYHAIVADTGCAMCSGTTAIKRCF
jgi:hypothetical protein